MSRKKLYFVIALLVLSFGGYVAMTNTQNVPSTTPSYTTVRPQNRDMGTWVVATGIVKPKVGAEVRVGSRVSGIVKKLYVNVGDHVQKNTILAEIDPLELQSRKERAQAALDNARAVLRYSKANFNRLERLFQQEYIASDELDLARRNLETSQSEVNRLKADLKFATTQLNFTRITAPIDGVVASVSTQEGETVAASFASPTFVTLINLDRLEVWAYVDETDIGRIVAEQEVVFTVDTYADTQFKGVVKAIYPKAELKDNVVNYVVTIEIEDFLGKTLRPEMTTSTRIYMDTRKNTLSIPTKALTWEDGQAMVYLLNSGHPERRLVQTGVKNRKFTEILEGLGPSDKVILNQL